MLQQKSIERGSSNVSVANVFSPILRQRRRPSGLELELADIDMDFCIHPQGLLPRLRFKSSARNPEPPGWSLRPLLRCYVQASYDSEHPQRAPFMPGAEQGAPSHVAFTSHVSVAPLSRG